MSEYQVLARKYRPQSFCDVVAQSPIVATLKNAILLKRTAHAYLFCGSRGTGKTTLARLFAKALNCASLSKEIEPCNQCPSCKEIASGHAIDVLEIDGASHRGIEDIRKINETIGFSPICGHYKIYLIDEVHMLTKEAFNALLKTLEEPPSHAKFFFCTTEPHKIPATILSRCQRFNLRRIPLEKMVDKLEKIAQDSSVETEKEALVTLSEMAEGSLRDALSLFDQIIAFSNGKITLSTVSEALGLPSKETLFALAAAGEARDYTAPFNIAGEIFSSGKNLSFFLEELTTHFRTLMLVKSRVITSHRDQKRYAETSALYRPEQLIQILELLTDAQSSIKNAPSERTALEMLLLRILRTHHQISLESLVERLISLEKQLSQAPVRKDPPLVIPAPVKPSISEDPVPKPEELPVFKKKSQTSVPPAPSQEKPISKSPSLKPEQTQTPSLKKPPQPEPTTPLSVQEQSRFDTIMRFAAKELNGSLKKP